MKLLQSSLAEILNLYNVDIYCWSRTRLRVHVAHVLQQGCRRTGDLQGRLRITYPKLRYAEGNCAYYRWKWWRSRVQWHRCTAFQLFDLRSRPKYMSKLDGGLRARQNHRPR